MDRLLNQRRYPFTGIAVCFSAAMFYEAELLSGDVPPDSMLYFTVPAFFAALTALSLRLFPVYRVTLPLHLLTAGTALLLPFSAGLPHIVLQILFCIGTGMLLSREPEPLVRLGTGLFAASLFAVVLPEAALPELLFSAAAAHAACCITVRRSPVFRFVFTVLLLGVLFHPDLQYHRRSRTKEYISVERDAVLDIYRYGKQADRIFLDEHGKMHPGDLLPFFAAKYQLPADVVPTVLNHYPFPFFAEENLNVQYIYPYLYPHPDRALSFLEKDTKFLVLVNTSPLTANAKYLFSHRYLEKLTAKLAPDGVLAIRVPHGVSCRSLRLPETGTTAHFRGTNTCWLVYRPAGCTIAVPAPHIPEKEKATARALQIVFPVLQLQGGCEEEKPVPVPKIQTLYLKHSKRILTGAALLLTIYLLLRYLVNTKPLHKPSFRAVELGVIAGAGTIGTALAVCGNGGSIPVLFQTACLIFPLAVLLFRSASLTVALLLAAELYLLTFSGLWDWQTGLAVFFCALLFALHLRRQPDLPGQENTNILTQRFLAGFALAAVCAVFCMAVCRI